MGKRNTGTIQPGEVRNPKGRPRDLMPRTVFRNAVMSLITEQHHIKALNNLINGLDDKNATVRMEATKQWHSYFPPNERVTPTQKKLRTQQDVWEYSTEYLDLMLSEFSFSPDKLMNLSERHSGFIRTAAVEKELQITADANYE